MKLYLLTWLAVSYRCPWGLGVLPEPMKRLACVREERLDNLFTSYSLVAEAKVRELGPGAVARLEEIQGGRKRKIEIAWDQVLRLEK